MLNASMRVQALDKGHVQAYLDEEGTEVLGGVPTNVSVEFLDIPFVPKTKA